MNKALFITFEGPDGSGKSTQIKLFRDFLENAGHKVLLTREPGGTEISEKIRNLILDPENVKMDARTEALLYSASRAQLVHEYIAPALALGKTVLCDRFMDSSIAYQGFARALGDGVRVINEFAIGDVHPDITFFLDLDPRIGLERAGKNRGKLDRLEQEALEFHIKVYEAYCELSKIYKDRYIRIDASGDIDTVAEEIKRRFTEYAGSRK